ncbi:glycosyltransferase family 31 protein [Sphaerobolus stellatus SS14]|uniref:Glycosyltransferase family 31 protein n=1 Tax=Sphaerobolus stellatus (strain SS14) TaxID=990650 RepID=A0A0C9TMD3_SPHS4|nr:glycosyltransferase family 31 protein [Sphaerobolus stellatus SS14]
MRYFPRQPASIILSLLGATVISILITLLLIHILNPDKAPLPWRAYCSVPPSSVLPPSTHLAPTDENFILELPEGIDPTSPEASQYTAPFPPSYFDDLPPSGVFLGVFSIDSGIERRMLIRSTWASHVRSRNGADPGDGGNGTSRTIVRFVLGKPRSDWERRVQLEMDTYNDIVVLPISENMNYGKTHAYFTWAAEHAWVPSLSSPLPQPFSYSNDSHSPPPLAPHDPHFPSTSAVSWVRPDYVAKVDDDAFVMLAELEGRLRVALHQAVEEQHMQQNSKSTDLAADDYSMLPSPKRASDAVQDRSVDLPNSVPRAPVSTNTSASSLDDPLIYWGYLVKNRFMAGELYALSYSIVKWVSFEPKLKSLTRGAEDKQTAKWMRLHPRAAEIRWASERCWIYDHPRAGTVYAHGFLFPSEVSRIKQRILDFLQPVSKMLNANANANANAESFPVPFPSKFQSIPDSQKNSTIMYTLPPADHPSTPSYTYSSVTHFGTHYTFPLPSLTSSESIEALVEGSHMSHVFEGGPETAKQAWSRREGRRSKYEGRRLGGTVVVHFIKRNEWFLEAVMAFLGGEDDDPKMVPKELGVGEHGVRMGAHGVSPPPSPPPPPMP